MTLRSKLARQREQRFHIRALAVQVHRHQRAHAPAGGAVHQLARAPLAVPLEERAHGRRPQVESVRVDVAEHGPRADARDRAGSGEERVRRSDDLVTGADAEPHQREQERIGAGGHPDRVRDAAVGGGGGFEGRHVATQDELLRSANPGDACGDFCGQRRVLWLEIEQGHRHRRAGRGGSHAN